MISHGTRLWLPPVCLVALITAVWALPYRPDCDSLAWGDDPAIARVDRQCILLFHYADSLHIIETNIENSEFGLLIDELSSNDYQRRWNDRVNFYGPETVALAAAIRDSALHQRAFADGHAPSQEEVSVRLDLDRLRWESFHDVVQLAKLAQNEDLAGFRKLAAETRDPDIVRFLEDLTPSELMESMKGNDWRQLEQALKEGEAHLESLGLQRYWQEILPAKLRREMAILKLEGAVLEASANGPDGPQADVPRLAWLAYQERAFEGLNIELTHAAPPTASVDGALAYLAEVLQEEQEELGEEYRRRFGTALGKTVIRPVASGPEPQLNSPRPRTRRSARPAGRWSQMGPGTPLTISDFL